MEDFKTGKQCDVEGCSLLDYLNYTCQACDKNLCKSHYHNEYNCPYDLDPNSKFKQVEKECKMISDMEYIICAFCHKKVLKYKGSVVCGFCDLVFCFNHRIESSHNCSKDGKKGKKEQAHIRKNAFIDKLSKLKKK